MRLEAMAMRLEDEQSAEHVASIYASAYANVTGQRNTDDRIMVFADHQRSVRQRNYMWYTLSDLLVVCRPEWPSTQGVAASILFRHPTVAHRSYSDRYNRDGCGASPVASVTDRIRVPRLNLTNGFEATERSRYAPTMARAESPDVHRSRRPAGRWGVGAALEDSFSAFSAEPERRQLFGDHPRPRPNLEPQPQLGYLESSACPSFCVEASPHFGPRSM